MAKRRSRSELIQAAAKAAYGEPGLSRLAEAADVSKQTLAMGVSGDRTITDATLEKVAGALEKQSEKVSAIAAEIRREIGRSK